MSMKAEGRTVADLWRDADCMRRQQVSACSRCTHMVGARSAVLQKDPYFGIYLAMLDNALVSQDEAPKINDARLPFTSMLVISSSRVIVSIELTHQMPRL
jgi:hypothetical protein